MVYHARPIVSVSDNQMAIAIALLGDTQSIGEMSQQILRI